MLSSDSDNNDVKVIKKIIDNDKEDTVTNTKTNDLFDSSSEDEDDGGTIDNTDEILTMATASDRVARAKKT